ncbi:MAG: hypothetical protein HN348_27745, partial [Proteobacteria bacterium]|nr:hypothetical protein [Pseudomonadota bacterium]
MDIRSLAFFAFLALCGCPTEEDDTDTTDTDTDAVSGWSLTGSAVDFQAQTTSAGEGLCIELL